MSFNYIINSVWAIQALNLSLNNIHANQHLLFALIKKLFSLRAYILKSSKVLFEWFQELIKC